MVNVNRFLPRKKRNKSWLSFLSSTIPRPARLYFPVFPDVQSAWIWPVYGCKRFSKLWRKWDSVSWLSSRNAFIETRFVASDGQRRKTLRITWLKCGSTYFSDGIYLIVALSRLVAVVGRLIAERNQPTVKITGQGGGGVSITETKLPSRKNAITA